MSGSEGFFGRVYQAEVDYFHARPLQAIGELGGVFFQAGFEAGELGPIGFEADAEEAQAEGEVGHRTMIALPAVRSLDMCRSFNVLAQKDR
jgi:hypothetical protein